MEEEIIEKLADLIVNFTLDCNMLGLDVYGENKGDMIELIIKISNETEYVQ